MDEPWTKLTDDEILTELLKCEELDEAAREAFESMRMRLPMQKDRTLSYKQRNWANSVYEKLRPDLDEVANLVSSGKVPVPKNLPTFEWEKNKPLKPPGRK